MPRLTITNSCGIPVEVVINDRGTKIPAQGQISGDYDGNVGLLIRPDGQQAKFFDGSDFRTQSMVQDITLTVSVIDGQKKLGFT
jgi:hypothetical protein